MILNVTAAALFLLPLGRILYAFDHLPDTATMQGPLFVFAHIFAAHPPFVFDSAGNIVKQKRRSFWWRGPLDKWEWMNDYSEQITFINDKLMAALDEILDASQTPPVIIISGDHGSRLTLRE